jgi:predicted O-methyltransferase YrrM
MHEGECHLNESLESLKEKYEEQDTLENPVEFCECFYLSDNYLNFYGRVWNLIEHYTFARLKNNPKSIGLKYALTLCNCSILDINHKDNNIWEGYSLQCKKECLELINILQNYKCDSIMEIGFNAGHSSTLFLTNSNETTKVVSFDLGSHDYLKDGKKAIDKLFPNRHELILGDSKVTVPEYIKHNPKKKFDIIFIDGGHEYQEAISDLFNCQELAHENTIVIMDDTVMQPELERGYNIGVNKAWKYAVKNGFVREIYSQDYEAGKGMSYGYYISKMKDLHDLIYVDYKHLTISKLYDAAFHRYNERNLPELQKVCELYLNYFGKMNDDRSKNIRFWLGFSLFGRDNERATKVFEDLYDEPVLEEGTRFYTMCNLGAIYPKDNSPIPKLIHLLYFGETEFMNFHYECIKSMSMNMPNYNIIIYNKKEPIGNVYWEGVKKLPNILIEKIDVPEEYDGFPLSYFQYKADVVRLNVLYEKGGVYLDIDMLVIKNFDHIINSGKGFYISEEYEKGKGLINAFIASKPRNGFLKLWLESFKTGLRMENWAYHIRESNKKLLEDHKHYMLKYNIEILESKYFFPFHWSQRDKFINIEENLNDDVHCIHLFETILQDVLIDNKYWTRKINKFPCDEIAVLCLEEYPDNQKHMENFFYNNNLDGMFFINKLNPRPIIGCFESHINAIRYAREKKYKSIMILEDDVVANERLENISFVYPEEWDMLYFGGILINHTEIKNGWVKGTIWCNHAYIIKENLYDIVVELFDSFNKDVLFEKKRGIDWLFTTFIHPKYNCWLYEKQAIVQKEGYSRIEDKMRWGNNFDWSTWSMKFI